MVPGPANPIKPVALVEDKGPIHTSKLSLAALAAPRALAHRPAAAQVCAGIERHRTRLARSRGASCPAHQTFAEPDALDQQIHQAVAALNAPNARPFRCTNPQIS